jgi:hypothetical protein
MSRGALFGYASFAAVGLVAIARGTVDLCAAAPPGHRLPAALIALGVPLFAFYGAAARDKWREARRAQAGGSALGPGGNRRMERLLQARDFLPEALPEGWSAPVASGGSDSWVLDVGPDALIVQLEPSMGAQLVKALIVPRGRKEPVSDERSREILGNLRDLGEFIEVVPPHGLPQPTRVWAAWPRGARPRLIRSLQSLPPESPILRDRPLPWHMTASRRHFPSKLPIGWSAPLALDEMGGIWMIDVEDFPVLMAYAMHRDRITLAVTIIPPEGEEVSETFALSVLKHLRGVGEFVPTDVADKVPGARMYLGAVHPEESARRSVLN